MLGLCIYHKARKRMYTLGQESLLILLGTFRCQYRQLGATEGRLGGLVQVPRTLAWLAWEFPKMRTLNIGPQIHYDPHRKNS